MNCINSKTCIRHASCVDVQKITLSSGNEFSDQWKCPTLVFKHENTAQMLILAKEWGRYLKKWRVGPPLSNAPNAVSPLRPVKFIKPGKKVSSPFYPVWALSWSNYRLQSKTAKLPLNQTKWGHLEFPGAIFLAKTLKSALNKTIENVLTNA